MSENSTNARAEEKARTNELPHHIANLLYTSQALPAQVLERSELRIAYVPGIMPGNGSPAGMSATATARP